MQTNDRSESGGSIQTRPLITGAALYGLADMFIMAVGGFLLLPLYTRSITQAEFGYYIAIRTNIDILTYLLQFGLPSALGRLYHDYKKNGTERQYLNALLSVFAVLFIFVTLILTLFGSSLWELLSPMVPVKPYLQLSFAIAAVSFLSAVSTIWLRMEGRAELVFVLQIGGAILIVLVAAIMLKIFDAGLIGILLAIFAGPSLSAIVLLKRLGKNFCFTLPQRMLGETFHYALPILAGYIAYFLLNRVSTLILQHEVSSDELAIFGLAQQLSMIAMVACTAFGMALQPMVYSAEKDLMPQIFIRSSRILVLLMLAVCGSLIIYSHEIYMIVAPRDYEGGLLLFTILVAANFTNTFTLMSDMVMLYHRCPKRSVAVSILSAILATLVSFWLIANYKIIGAAISIFFGFAVRMILANFFANRFVEYERSVLIACSFIAVGIIGWAAHLISFTSFSGVSLLVVKTIVALIWLAVLFVFAYRWGYFRCKFITRLL